MRQGLLLVAAVSMISAHSNSFAQEQEAGKLTDTEAVFQKLVEQCDNVDMLMLRARIRLELPRTTEEAAGVAREKLLQGFELCASGNMAEGKVVLEEGYEIAKIGVTEKFGQEGTGGDETTVSEPKPVETASNKKPWWKFW